MEKIFKSVVKSSLFTSFVLLILGILLFIKSDDTIVAISYLVGGVIIILGILALVNFFRKKERDFATSFDIIYGIITIVFGIFILSNPKMVASVIPFVIGACILIKSSFKIAYSMELKNHNMDSWKGALIISVISALVGVVMVFNPFKTSVLVFKIIGAAIIIYSVLDIVSSFQFKAVDVSFDSNSKGDTSRTDGDNEQKAFEVDDEDITEAVIEDVEQNNNGKKKGKSKKKRSSAKENNK